MLVYIGEGISSNPLLFSLLTPKQLQLNMFSYSKCISQVLESMCMILSMSLVMGQNRSVRLTLALVIFMLSRINFIKFISIF